MNIIAAWPHELLTAQLRTVVLWTTVAVRVNRELDTGEGSWYTATTAFGGVWRQLVALKASARTLWDNSWRNVHRDGWIVSKIANFLKCCSWLRVHTPPPSDVLGSIRWNDTQPSLNLLFPRLATFPGPVNGSTRSLPRAETGASHPTVEVQCVAFSAFRRPFSPLLFSLFPLPWRLVAVYSFLSSCLALLISSTSNNITFLSSSMS